MVRCQFARFRADLPVSTELGGCPVSTGACGNPQRLGRAAREASILPLYLKIKIIGFPLVSVFHPRSQMCCELFTDEENMMKMFQSLQRTKNRSHTDPSPPLPQPKEFKRSFGFNWTITATKEPKRSGSGTFPEASQAQEGRRPETKPLSCLLRRNRGRGEV